MKKLWSVALLVVGVFAAACSHQNNTVKASSKLPSPRVIQSATPAPFEVSSPECSNSDNGFRTCTASATFVVSDKKYDAFSVAFMLTTSDGNQEIALATKDIHQAHKVFQPGEVISVHTPMFKMTNNETQQLLTITDIAVQSDVAVDTDGQVWGNKSSLAVEEFLLRRAGFTQEEIMKRVMQMHGGMQK